MTHLRPCPQPVGELKVDDFIAAFESWIVVCIARAYSHQRFIKGGRRPMLVMSDEGDPVHD